MFAVGHVTAVTVSPEYRRLGIAPATKHIIHLLALNTHTHCTCLIKIGVANNLMRELEKISNVVYNAHFVDLFVRKTNALAIAMYTQLGYSIFRRVLSYYSDNSEDAYDMRKALVRDVHKSSIVVIKETITPAELEW